MYGHSAKQGRVADILHWSQKLLDCFGWFEYWSHIASAQQPANMISHPMDIGQHSEANILLRHQSYSPASQSSHNIKLAVKASDMNKKMFVCNIV